MCLRRSSFWKFKSMLVAELAELYLASQSKMWVDHGRKWRRSMRILLSWWGTQDIAKIGQADFDRYAAEQLQAGLSPGTVHCRLSLLRSALHFGVRKGLRQPFAPLSLPTPRPPRYEELTPEEADRLLRHAPDNETRCFMAIALTTGARREAICELTWDRVDLETRTFDFDSPHALEHRRQGRARLPITPILADFLRAYRDYDQPRPNDRVCRWCSENVGVKVAEAGRRAGIDKPVTPRTLRHTAAIRMLRAVPLIYASRALGHLAVKTTERIYRQSTAESLRPVALALNDLLVT